MELNCSLLEASGQPAVAAWNDRCPHHPGGNGTEAMRERGQGITWGAGDGPCLPATPPMTKYPSKRSAGVDDSAGAPSENPQTLVANLPMSKIRSSDLRDFRGAVDLVRRTPESFTNSLGPCKAGSC
jgi:hypothetical protein